MTSRRSNKPTPHFSELKQITTRILPESAKLLETIAFEERRTISSQLAHIVEAFLTEQKKKRSKVQAVTE